VQPPGLPRCAWAEVHNLTRAEPDRPTSRDRFKRKRRSCRGRAGWKQSQLLPVPPVQARALGETEHDGIPVPVQEAFTRHGRPHQQIMGCKSFDLGSAHDCLTFAIQLIVPEKSLRVPNWFHQRCPLACPNVRPMADIAQCAGVALPGPRCISSSGGPSALSSPFPYHPDRDRLPHRG
jgi:hypothetical protein